MSLLLYDFQNRSYLKSLDFLRGFAACAVMIYHFTIHTTITLSSDNWLRQIGRHGDYGVQVFFIISGIVIPYSLARSDFKFSADILNFLKRRILRIDIPYIVVIVMEIALIVISSVTPWAGRALERLDGVSLLLHLGYLNAFFGKEWLLPIFWTLAIEFQFYILIALIFPFINLNKASANLSIVGLVVLKYLFPVPSLIFTYLLFFAIGIALYFYKIKKINLINLLILLISLLLLVYSSYNLIVLILMVLTILVILFLHELGPLASFLGKISFSIYLLHIPVGGRILAIAERSGLAESYKSTLILVSIAITILVSYLFYRWVEKPALAFSKSGSLKGVFSSNKLL